MKKIVCIAILVTIALTGVFAIDLSVGGSMGLGLSFLGGDDYDEYDEAYKTLESAGLTVDESRLAFSPQFDVLVAFTPRFSLETGIALLHSKESREFNYMGEILNMEATRTQLTVPALLRTSFEYPVSLGKISAGITYFSAGVKMGIPIDTYMKQRIKTSSPPIDAKPEIDSAPFVLDFAIAIGQEFRITKSHHIGLRIGYDFNLTAPFDKDDPDAGDSVDLYHNTLLFGITYRYAL